MRIVVTGGAGFLGSHLCQKLVSLGHTVCCVDNLTTGRYENIQDLVENSKFEFFRRDVSKSIYLDGPIDAVLHFASPASPPDYFGLPIQTLKVGSIGTHNALGLAKSRRARFLLASTSEVYGDPLVNPQPEEYWGNVNPIGVRSVYDEAKRFAEAITVAYYRVHRLDVRVARIFNTYGPRMRPDDGRVVSNFIIQALKGESLTVYGDGSQTRSLCYVSDLVEGILRLMLGEQEGEEPSLQPIFRSIHGPVNLGNPREIRVIDLARLVIRLTGSSSQIQFLPLPLDDPKVRCPDIARARRLLAWEPLVDVETGIKKTIAYFCSVLPNWGNKTLMSGMPSTTVTIQT